MSRRNRALAFGLWVGGISGGLLGWVIPAGPSHYVLPFVLGVCWGHVSWLWGDPL